MLDHKHLRFLVSPTPLRGQSICPAHNEGGNILLPHLLSKISHANSDEATFPRVIISNVWGMQKWLHSFVNTGGTGVQFAFSDFPSSSGVLVTFLNRLFLTS